MASQQQQQQQQDEQHQQQQLSAVWARLHPHQVDSLLRIYDPCNVSWILQRLPEQQQREEAIESMVAEAEARHKDPVLGCVGTIHRLLHTIHSLQTQIVHTQNQIQILSINSAPVSTHDHVDDDDDRE